MAPYRALIVEDSIDVRRALKAAIELLLQDFQVADVPSAEEGLLEFFRQPVDLLITDFRLPGMTGFELMERMRTKKPDMKVIMVTGMPEPEYRSQALKAGADAFFYKPIEIADLIAAVRSIFSLPIPTQTPAELAESRPPTLGELLAQLRLRTHAQAVFMLDDLGHPAAQAGEFRELEPNAPFLSVLMAAVNASRKLSKFLGNAMPESLLYTRGNQTAFLAAPLEDDLTLLLVLPQSEFATAQSLNYADMRPVLEQLHTLLHEMGMAEPPRSPSPDVPDSPRNTPTEIYDHDLELEAIVQAGTPRKLMADDLNAYWEKLASAEEISHSTNPEVLSYEEARRLGLTPDTNQAPLTE